MTNEKTIEELRADFKAKTTVKTIVEIDYNDLDIMINEYFGRPVNDGMNGGYECVPYQEWNNDSQHSYNVRPIDTDDDIIKAAYAGKWQHYGLHNYINELGRAGIIPECELVVNVCW